MTNILESAAKIAFLLLTLTACIAFIIGRLSSSDFMILAGSAFAFYFANKGDADQPYAGK